MADIAIHIHNLSKQHKICTEKQMGFKEKITSFFTNKQHFETSATRHSNTFWALKNVSLDINKGDAIGIIGKNGAGKSTLLKILSEITSPSEGNIEIFGKTASVLEIGMGFHPDLSGRENIYFSGSLMGMKRKEIDSRYQSIVAFSGISDFIETPVKHYSTGMYVRLAFAVVAHVEADILLLDEVLTVGDAEYKYKTFQKIKSLLGQGKTIVMVSHNLSEILEICNKAIILDKGQIKSIGNPFHIAAEYLSRHKQDDEVHPGVTDDTILDQNQVSWDNPETAPGNAQVKVQKISILACGQNNPGPKIYMKDEILLIIEIQKSESLHFDAAFILKDILGNPLFSSTTALYQEHKTSMAGAMKYTCKIPSNLLNTGTFSITVALLDEKHKVFLTLKNILFFKIHFNPEEVGQAWEGRFNEPLRPLLHWKIEKKS